MDAAFLSVEDLMDVGEIRTETCSKAFGEPDYPTDELVVHLEHRRLQQELHLMYIDEVTLALLHADVGVEEVLPLPPLGLTLWLVKQIIIAVLHLLWIQHIWKELPALAVDIVVELEVAQAELHVLVVLCIDDQEFDALQVAQQEFSPDPLVISGDEGNVHHAYVELHLALTCWLLLDFIEHIRVID